MSESVQPTKLSLPKLFFLLLLPLVVIVGLMIGIHQRFFSSQTITFQSDINSLTIKVDDQDKLDTILDQSGIWEDYAATVESANQPTPYKATLRKINVILTDEVQAGDNSIADGQVFRSLEVTYLPTDDPDEVTVKIHIDPSAFPDKDPHQFYTRHLNLALVRTLYFLTADYNSTFLQQKRELPQFVRKLLPVEATQNPQSLPVQVGPKQATSLNWPFGPIVTQAHAQGTRP